MADWHLGLLNVAQATSVERLLGVPRLVADLSWGLVDTRVLHVQVRGRDFVVKAAGSRNHHIGREITAHERYTEPLVELDRTAQFVGGDRAANVLVTDYQPGELVEGTPYEHSADTYLQAGSALREFHDQYACVDDEYESRMTVKAIAWLDREHRIAPGVEADARQILNAYRPASMVVVPTHGDWHPRNWLIDDGWLRVIDFGRFDLRPPATDLCRLAMQQWAEVPTLETAFIDGYGTDPRDERVWHVDLLREAVGTAVWAFQVGDVAFEDQGHRMLDAAIARF